MLDTITYLHAKFQLIPTKFSTDVFLNSEIGEFFSAVPPKNVGSRSAKTDERKNKKIAENVGFWFYREEVNVRRCSTKSTSR